MFSFMLFFQFQTEFTVNTQSHFYYNYGDLLVHILIQQNLFIKKIGFNIHLFGISSYIVHTIAITTKSPCQYRRGIKYKSKPHFRKLGHQLIDRHSLKFYTTSNSLWV